MCGVVVAYAEAAGVVDSAARVSLAAAAAAVVGAAVVVASAAGAVVAAGGGVVVLRERTGTMLTALSNAWLLNA